MTDPRHEHSHAHDHPGPHGHSEPPHHGAPAGDRDERRHRSGLLGLVASLFRPHSHDAADSLDDALAGSAAGIKAVQLSLIGLALTAFAQLAVVLLSGSVSLLADAIHNFADASTAIPLWLAFALSRKAANRRFTYGYGRAEDLAGVFVVAMIAASSVVVAWESLQRLIHPHPITHLPAVVIAALVGCLGNELVAQYRIRTGSRISSAALVADGYHARTDGLTSLAVLLGVVGVWLGYPRADPLVGLGITIAILFILKGAAAQIWRRLLDAVDPRLLDAIEEAARTADGVQQVSGIRVRWMGHSLHAEAQVVAARDLTLTQAHAVAEEARHAMLHAAPKLAVVTVHVDPSSSDGHDPHAALSHHDRSIGTEPTPPVT